MTTRPHRLLMPLILFVMLAPLAVFASKPTPPPPTTAPESANTLVCTSRVYPMGGSISPATDPTPEQPYGNLRFPFSYSLAPPRVSATIEYISARVFYQIGFIWEQAGIVPPSSHQFYSINGAGQLVPWLPSAEQVRFVGYLNTASGFREVFNVASISEGVNMPIADGEVFYLGVNSLAPSGFGNVRTDIAVTVRECVPAS